MISALFVVMCSGIESLLVGAFGLNAPFLLSFGIDGETPMTFLREGDSLFDYLMGCGYQGTF